MQIPSLPASLQDTSHLVIHWFRRDLRLADNHGLYQALQQGSPVLPLFIFDPAILDRLINSEDRRVKFIHDQLSRLKIELEKYGSSLLVCYGDPLVIFQQLTSTLHVQAVHTNKDYEPQAIQRDSTIAAYLATQQVDFCAHKDQVIFEEREVIKRDGTPYSVFTPYMRQWKAQLRASMLEPFDSASLLHHCVPTAPLPHIALSTLGFCDGPYHFPSKTIDIECIAKYDQTRDIPSIAGTSRLGAHLRFGTISIREAARTAHLHNEVWLNELIWREFYMMILWHFPHVVDRSFKAAYDRIAWRNDRGDFQAWCAGKTGYPIVDAGMRELNETGYMHNRVRMITASFLTKHLLIDWRWGEAYFAAHLLDFELASNNGGWQWVAGSGCDAAPYFRVFNPALQTKKFDPALRYIKKWVPELATHAYPQPIVDHQQARLRALAAYKKALNNT